MKCESVYKTKGSKLHSCNNAAVVRLKVDHVSWPSCMSCADAIKIREPNAHILPLTEDALSTEAYEHVNHPKHYNQHPSGVECITVVEHMTFNIGTAMKYMWRAGLKPGNDSIQDLKKASWYINREIERLEKK